MNYTKHISVQASAASAFSALANQLADWWGPTDLPVHKVGDQFTIRFDQAYWSFEIIEYQEHSVLTWKCIDGDPEFNKEWIGNVLYWKIKESGNQVHIEFLHYGLTPDVNCYDICAPTWSKFITESLKNFLETGRGMPYVQPA